MVDIPSTALLQKLTIAQREVLSKRLNSQAISHASVTKKENFRKSLRLACRDIAENESEVPGHYQARRSVFVAVRTPRTRTDDYRCQCKRRMYSRNCHQ